MCGIIGSFSKNKIIELSKINSTRGNKTFSLSVLNVDCEILRCVKVIGNFSESVFNEIDNLHNQELYYILHIQSPTKVTKITTQTIHPAIYDDNYLWHNGMIIERNMNIIKEKYSYDSNWDTGLILKMVTEGIDTLEEIEGSFGCLLLKDNNFYIFRNNIVPMYYDDDLNISSTEFENSTKLNSNIVYDIDLKNKKLNYFKQFKNEHNPYKF
tara:strand:+ start:97 stop:732 length:636 start_codon:yes stop_codon:yes gene_type:complete